MLKFFWRDVPRSPDAGSAAWCSGVKKSWRDRASVVAKHETTDIGWRGIGAHSHLNGIFNFLSIVLIVHQPILNRPQCKVFHTHYYQRNPVCGALIPSVFREIVGLHTQKETKHFPSL